MPTEAPTLVGLIPTEAPTERVGTRDPGSDMIAAVGMMPVGKTEVGSTEGSEAPLGNRLLKIEETTAVGRAAVGTTATRLVGFSPTEAPMEMEGTKDAGSVMTAEVGIRLLGRIDVGKTLGTDTPLGKALRTEETSDAGKTEVGTTPTEPTVVPGSEIDGTREVGIDTTAACAGTRVVALVVTAA